MPRLKDKYKQDIVPALVKEFNYINVNQVPRITKIVVNVGLGEALQNAKALEIFGKRGATVAAILATSTKETDKLTKALRNSAGAAASVASTQLNTLQGSVKLLNSAWQGLFLSIDKGSGGFSSFLRSAVNGITSLTTAFSELIENSPIEELENEREEVNRLATELGNTNLKAEERAVLLEKLRGLNSDVVEGLTAENLNLSILRENLENYNKEVVNKILLAGGMEEEKGCNI